MKFQHPRCVGSKVDLFWKMTIYSESSSKQTGLPKLQKTSIARTPMARLRVCESIEHYIDILRKIHVFWDIVLKSFLFYHENIRYM